MLERADDFSTATCELWLPVEGASERRLRQDSDRVDLDQQVGLAQRRDRDEGDRLDRVDAEPRGGPPEALAQGGELLLAPVDDVERQLRDVVERAAGRASAVPTLT